MTSNMTSVDIINLVRINRNAGLVFEGVWFSGLSSCPRELVEATIRALRCAGYLPIDWYPTHNLISELMTDLSFYGSGLYAHVEEYSEEDTSWIPN